MSGEKDERGSKGEQEAARHVGDAAASRREKEWNNEEWEGGKGSAGDLSSQGNDRRALSKAKKVRQGERMHDFSFQMRQSLPGAGVEGAGRAVCPLPAVGKARVVEVGVFQHPAQQGRGSGYGALGAAEQGKALRQDVGAVGEPTLHPGPSWQLQPGNTPCSVFGFSSAFSIILTESLIKV